MVNVIVFYGIPGLLAIMGLVILLQRENLIKMLIGLSVMETGVNLFIVGTNDVLKGTAPIIEEGFKIYCDPIPQALVLTAIVIGVATTALGLALVIRIYEKKGGISIKDIKEMKW